MNQTNNPSRRAILLVDDDGDHRWLMTDALRSAGWDGPIESASTAGQALAMLDAPGAAFDLVLLDVHMPGMDGLDLLGLLRGSFTAEQLPVVIVSGSGRLGSTRQHAFTRGANDFIPKCPLPTMIDRLVPILARYGSPRQPHGAAHE